jgi:integrase
LIGNRDRAILVLLLGCGLRRQELAQLKLDDIVEREGRTVIVDLVGKGRRVRTVAVPHWVKQSVNQWTKAAGIIEGPFASPGLEIGQAGRNRIGDLVGWSVVECCAKEIRIKEFGPHDLCRTCAKLLQKSWRCVGWTTFVENGSWRA